MQYRATSLALGSKYPAKRAFITGAGSGLGLAFALELASNGWHIGLADVDADRLAAAATVVINAGGTPTTYAFDVAEYDKFGDAVADFVAQLDGIDIAINNAGIGCGGKFDEVPIELFQQVVNTNLMGVVHGCHLFVPIMKRQGSGHILNVASAAAFVAAPRMSAYNTSKAGVLALSETLRGELHDDGVMVSVLMPTYVRTNIGADAIGTPGDKAIAEMLVDQSQLSAQEVARKTLEKMGAGVFYIILPSEARNLWRLKRYFPGNFWRFVNQKVKRIVAMDT